MQIALAVYGAPQSSQASHSALRFAQAAVAAGHEVSRVFFYQDGVLGATTLAAPPQDEHDPHEEWRKFAALSGAELVVCVASALRRGILDETEATRYEKTGASLGPPFAISGLGQLIDAAIEADRLVTFGA